MSLPILAQIDPTEYTVLVIDDAVPNLHVMMTYLSSVGFRVLTARSGESGLQRAQIAQPDLILLDVLMPGLNGFETCERLKADPATAEIPVIFITALGSIQDKSRGFSAGAVDYVTKPFQREEVLARVTTHLRIRDLTQNLERQVRQRTAELETANRELVEARDKAEAASRAKSTFLSLMSHELRTPLNAIIGYTEILQEDCDDQGHDDFEEPLSRIHASALHLLSVLKDILDLSKVEAGKMEVEAILFDVPLLIQRVAEVAHPLIVKHHNNFELECDESLGMMFSDSLKIRQILLNLLGNAAKFTRNGQIRLRVWQEADEKGKWLLFTVSDSGVGIKPEEMANLFKPFTQLQNQYTRMQDGTGLGLALCRHFCDMLGGEISAQSKYRSGTVFTVRLPWQVVDVTSYPEVEVEMLA